MVAELVRHLSFFVVLSIDSFGYENGYHSSGSQEALLLSGHASSPSPIGCSEVLDPAGRARPARPSSRTAFAARLPFSSRSSPPAYLKVRRVRVRVYARHSFRLCQSTWLLDHC